MNKEKNTRLTLVLFILTWFTAAYAWSDGGYFSSETVAVSADQRAIIIQNGNEISMTFSTGYTGEGEDFGWIIPVPVPPAIDDVNEAGEDGEKAFAILDEYTAPVVIKGGGCFSAGTEVLTSNGPLPIETVEPGAVVYSCNLTTGKWVLRKVIKRLTHHYEGDMVSIQLGRITIQATGNHPFYVLSGEQLISRPFPQDIPKEEQETAGQGRWVEARDLRQGDVLQDKGGEGLIITSLSSRQEKTEVYNLNVEDNHNYAVHQKGILVHNKGGSEDSGTLSTSPVTVYGTVILEHYDISILGASAASNLINWLQKNNYQINPATREVLDTYIKKNWAFAAVKLNPGERRHYDNEFLPPLTIRYQYDELIFPMHISSVSTDNMARVTLYVIAEGTVISSNFPTYTLDYDRRLLKRSEPESYIENCIEATTGNKIRGLAVLWKGEFHDEKIINGLLGNPFPEKMRIYLTRLEARLEPEEMTEDIIFKSDWRPKKFRVHSQGSEASANLREISFLIFMLFLLIGIPAFLIGPIIYIGIKICKSKKKPEPIENRKVKIGESEIPWQISASIAAMIILLFLSLLILVITKDHPITLIVNMAILTAAVINIVFLKKRRKWVYYFNLMILGFLVLLSGTVMIYVSISIWFSLFDIIWAVVALVTVGLLVWLMVEFSRRPEIREFYFKSRPEEND